MTTTIVAIQVAPIYPLWRISKETQSNKAIVTIMGVLLLFTALFSFVMLAFTRATRQEVIAAAAA